MLRPLWTSLSACISLPTRSPVSSDLILLRRAQPAPWLLTGLPGLTGPTVVLVLHLLHLLLAAAGTYCAGRPRLLLLDCRMEPLDSATNWFIRGAEEDLFKPFFIASSTCSATEY